MAAATTARVGLVFGTMTVATRCDEQASRALLDVARRYTHEWDTAIMYGGGQTEAMLGALGVGRDGSGDHVATKVNPFKTTPQPVDVGLHRNAVRAQFAHSLSALRVDHVDMLYLHAPDHEVPIMETLRAVDELHREGKFDRLGVSNYAAWQVAQICELCRQHGLITPSVYQGMYNAVTRQVETELFPCLREYGMAFYAYNPLAGGLLAGAYSFEDQPNDGRFNVNNMWGVKYRERYWKKELFATLNEVKAVAGNHGISAADAAHRWLVHHSKLDGTKGDKIILGASSVAHAEANFAACQAGPLPEDVLEAFNRGWQQHAANCPNYFR